MRITIIGATGFVGSAFVRHLTSSPVESSPGITVACVTRRNYAEFVGKHSDVVVDAAGNSKKFFADEDPVAEFEASVTHRLKTLLDFPAQLHVHISSVDVYSDLTSPETTREDSPIDLRQTSRYGVHKYLAEQLVQRHAQAGWVILRLAGMVGPCLRKNPVFDIVNDRPLRVHPESRYQFLNTDDVARIACRLMMENVHGQIFNLCGTGLISMQEIADMAGKKIDKSALPPDATPRVVEANNSKLRRIVALPETTETIRRFLNH